jgi:hypothetical protein
MTKLNARKYDVSAAATAAALSTVAAASSVWQVIFFAPGACRWSKVKLPPRPPLPTPSFLPPPPCPPRHLSPLIAPYLSHRPLSSLFSSSFRPSFPYPVATPSPPAGRLSSTMRTSARLVALHVCAVSDTAHHVPSATQHTAVDHTAPIKHETSTTCARLHDRRGRCRVPTCASWAATRSGLLCRCCDKRCS